jgi:hypothetical protein
VITVGEPISFVKAMQTFFTQAPYGKKIEILEFKALTREDKVELREELIREGFNVVPLPAVVTE